MHFVLYINIRYMMSQPNFETNFEKNTQIDINTRASIEIKLDDYLIKLNKILSSLDDKSSLQKYKLIRLVKDIDEVLGVLRNCPINMVIDDFFNDDYCKKINLALENAMDFFDLSSEQALENSELMNSEELIVDDNEVSVSEIDLKDISWEDLIDDGAESVASIACGLINKGNEKNHKSNDLSSQVENIVADTSKIVMNKIISPLITADNYLKKYEIELSQFDTDINTLRKSVNDFVIAKMTKNLSKKEKLEKQKSFANTVSLLFYDLLALNKNKEGLIGDDIETVNNVLLTKMNDIFYFIDRADYLMENVPNEKDRDLSDLCNYGQVVLAQSYQLSRLLLDM